MELFTEQIVPTYTVNQILEGAVPTSNLNNGSVSGGTVVGGRTIGGVMEGASYKSSITGARIEIFPESDKTIGFVSYAADGSVVFETLVSGTDIGDVIIGNYAGAQGAKWDQSAGTFSIKGALSASSLDIPDTTTANSFHVDTTGNAWWGATTLGSAVAKILKTGAATFTSISITGGIIDGTSTIGGRVGSILASAIDASGHFADSAISTATNTILGAFTFGVSGAIQIGTYVNGVTGDIRISPTGILGRDNTGATTFSINATTGVAVLNGLVVGTNVGLGTAQDSGGVTTIIGNTVTTSFVNALNITAQNVVASAITANEISTGLYAQIDANLPNDVNLMGYWSFDEGKDLTANDISGKGNTGSLIGTMIDADWVAGVAGTCLDFDGTDDYVNCGTGVNLALTDNVSLSCWVYIDTAIADNYGFAGNIRYSGGYKGGYALMQQYTGGVRRFAFWIGKSTEDDFIIARDDTKNVADYYNQWIHLVGVFNIVTDTVKLYLNGVEIATTTYTGINSANVNTFVIGTHPYAPGSQNLDGKVDEVRVYAQALTAKEVYALYQNRGGKGVMVPVGRLTTGSIYSKQITLAVAAGTGDTYIAAGKTDFTHTEKGFILGIDDSDSDEPKFYIGDTTVHFAYDKGNLDLRGTKRNKEFEGNWQDGLTESVGNATITRLPITTSMVRSTAGSWKLYTPTLAVVNDIVGGNLTVMYWAQDIDFYTKLASGDGQADAGGLAGEAYFWGLLDGTVNISSTLGDNGTALTTRHIGFFIGRDNKLYASSANGTNQEIDEIAGVTHTDEHEYKIVFDTGTKASYYIDGVYQSGHETYLPSGSVASPPDIHFENRCGRNITGGLFLLYNTYKVYLP